MDAEALKIILKLQEENTLYHRVLSDVYLILANKRYHNHIEYGLNDDIVSFVFDKLHTLYCPDNTPQTPCAWNKPPPETEAKLDAEFSKIGIHSTHSSNLGNKSSKTYSRVKWDKSLENDLNNDCNNCEYRRYNR